MWRVRCKGRALLIPIKLCVVFFRPNARRFPAKAAAKTSASDTATKTTINARCPPPPPLNRCHDNREPEYRLFSDETKNRQGGLLHVPAPPPAGVVGRRQARPRKGEKGTQGYARRRLVSQLVDGSAFNRIYKRTDCWYGSLFLHRVGFLWE